jgi:hypothetical protein
LRTSRFDWRYKRCHWNLGFHLCIWFIHFQESITRVSQFHDPVKLRAANNPSSRSSHRANIRRNRTPHMRSTVPPKVAKNEAPLSNGISLVYWKFEIMNSGIQTNPNTFPKFETVGVDVLTKGISLICWKFEIMSSSIHINHTTSPDF